MTFHRSTRRWLAGWLISSLLFMQLAVAAYVCPLRAPDAAAGMADMPDCPGMSAHQLDSQQAQLCKAHCGHDGQPLQLPQPQPAMDGLGPVLMALFDWRPQGLVVAPQSARRDVVASQAGPPRGWPPLYLSLLILRN